MEISFNYVGIKCDSGKRCLLTGLDSVMLNNLITYARDFCEEDPNFVLCREDQPITTLMKLRHNLTSQLLAHLVNTGKSTANNYFWKWIDILDFCLQFLGRIGDRAQIFQTIPPVFKSKFSRLFWNIYWISKKVTFPSTMLQSIQEAHNN